jgi:hypothetical protein
MLNALIAIDGTLATAVAIGITPDTLRSARRRRVLNGGTVTAITAYLHRQSRKA